jgi:hypothetical protein
MELYLPTPSPSHRRHKDTAALRPHCNVHRFPTKLG